MMKCMEQYDNITVHMNTEDIRKLDPIKPFPMVVESLTEAIASLLPGGIPTQILRWPLIGRTRTTRMCLNFFA